MNSYFLKLFLPLSGRCGGGAVGVGVLGGRDDSEGAVVATSGACGCGGACPVEFVQAQPRLEALSETENLFDDVPLFTCGKACKKATKRSISDTFLPMKYSSSRPFQVLSHSFCLVTLVVPHSSTSRSRLTDEAGLLRRRRRIIISSPFFLRRKVSPLIA